MNKQWYKSKTLWFNVLTVILAVAYHFGYQPNDVVIANVGAVFANPFFIGAVNLVLRWLTNKGIVFTQPTTGVVDSIPTHTT